MVVITPCKRHNKFVLSNFQLTFWLAQTQNRHAASCRQLFLFISLEEEKMNSYVSLVRNAPYCQYRYTAEAKNKENFKIMVF
jgi:hypothetical protein